MIDLDDLTSRAYAAYFRAGGNRQQPDAATSGPVTLRGLRYVVLRNPNGVLAVYRIRPSGALKGLKRYPRALHS